MPKLITIILITTLFFLLWLSAYLAAREKARRVIRQHLFGLYCFSMVKSKLHWHEYSLFFSAFSSMVLYANFLKKGVVDVSIVFELDELRKNRVENVELSADLFVRVCATLENFRDISGYRG